jgi:hypothetical protein
MQQHHSPLARSYALLALTSLFLLVALKAPLASWLSDLPPHALTKATQAALEVVPDFGLSEIYGSLRQRFLDATR